MNSYHFQSSSICIALIICTICTYTTHGLSLDNTHKSPLSVSNPISGDATAPPPSSLSAVKDLRRDETRYNNEPLPEFYK